MTKTVHARFDGKAFYPEEPLAIAPNTTVLLTVETSEAEESVLPPPAGPSATAVEGEPYSFLKFAMSLNLEGPKDWSENLDDYLYGGRWPSATSPINTCSSLSEKPGKRPC